MTGTRLAAFAQTSGRQSPIVAKQASESDLVHDVIVEIFPDLLWIALIAVVFWYLYRPFVQELIPRLTALKGFGVEATFTERRLIEASDRRKLPISPEARLPLMRRLAIVGRLFDRARILWVDDKPSNNAVEESLLAQLGARITSVTSSEETRSALTGDNYDVILSDMNREGRSDEGALFAARLAETRGAPPIIIYTGMDQIGLPRPIHLFGITNRPDELLHLLADVFERRRL